MDIRIVQRAGQQWMINGVAFIENVAVLFDQFLSRGRTLGLCFLFVELEQSTIGRAAYENRQFVLLEV